MRYNTQGIILRRQNFRDGDSFFSIYTLENGKVEAIARGTKKIKSKLGGHLDYFLIADLMIAEGKKFNHIGGALIEKNFPKIKKDFKKLNLGFYLLEITDHFIQGGKKDKRIFSLLKEYLTILDQDKRTLNYRFSLFFSYLYILKLLTYLGYTPDILDCIECKKKINRNNENYFSPISGGIVCDDCFKTDRGENKIKISKDILDSIEEVISKDLKDIDMENKKMAEMVGIIDAFLIYRLDREIKSRRFLVKAGS
jgi:DNA repair protein RecO (recombination protein O)